MLSIQFVHPWPSKLLIHQLEKLKVDSYISVQFPFWLFSCSDFNSVICNLNVHIQIFPFNLIIISVTDRHIFSIILDRRQTIFIFNHWRNSDNRAVFCAQKLIVNRRIWYNWFITEITSYNCNNGIRSGLILADTDTELKFVNQI